MFHDHMTVNYGRNKFYNTSPSTLSMHQTDLCTALWRKFGCEIEPLTSLLYIDAHLPNCFCLELTAICKQTQAVLVPFLHLEHIYIRSILIDPRISESHLIFLVNASKNLAHILIVLCCCCCCCCRCCCCCCDTR